ncbi:hypothetical protein [Vibrio alfacsensis]|uniref:hypothetical protein n=1 Tax=Vibrio alfacsensis TaxID=1074311 RepID=UPI0040683431
MSNSMLRYIPLILFFASADAIALCEGRMKLTPAMQTTSSPLEQNVLIPFKLELDERLQACAHTIYLYSKNGELGLKGKHTNYSFILLSKSREPLSMQGNYFEIPTSGKRYTDLWLSSRATYVPAGYYQGEVEAKINRLRNEINIIDFKFAIEPKASISFSAGRNTKLSGSGNFVIADLGELKTNNKHTVKLKIKANSSVKVDVSSEYGHLQHQNEPDAYIDYTMSLNHRAVTRRNSMLLDIGKVTRRTEIPLEIKIGDTGLARAGKYADIVHVTVNAY